MAALATALLILNVLTLTRFPFVNCDEVYFVDPVINLLNGDGFVSRAWDTSPDSRPLASTSPLYGAVLALWAKLVGYDLFALRVLGVLLTALALGFVLQGVQRWSLRFTPWWTLMLIALIPLAFGYAAAYRGGRPEPLVFLLWALIFYTSAAISPLTRYGATFVLAALMPFAGQIASLALGVLSVCLAMVWTRKLVRISIVVILGLVAGSVGFVLLYKTTGIYADYLAASQTVGGGLVERVIRRLTSSPFEQHRNAIPKDPTLLLLIGSLIGAVISALKDRSWHWRSPLTLGVIYSVGLPPTLYIVAKFPTYYSWVLVFPIAVVLCCWISTREQEQERTLWLHRTFFIAACAVGLPLQLLAAIPDWEARDHSKFVQWAGTVLKDDDTALVGYPQYFGAREYAGKIYLYGYGTQLTEADIESLTVLIMPKLSAYGMPREALMEKLGPGWTPTGQQYKQKASPFGHDLANGTFSLPNYDADVYRRDLPVDPVPR